MGVFLRQCPQCNRNIEYKHKRTHKNAMMRGTCCKSCNTKNVQATWTPEKRALAIHRMCETKNSLPPEIKQATVEKQRQSNKKTWATLPKAWVKATLDNPAWHEKLHNIHKNYKDPIGRGHAISEGKTGIPYDEWVIIKGRYEIYAASVRYYTNQQSIKTLPNYDLRGPETYHLDHKYSVVEGFRNNIAPEVIGNIVNLAYIPAKENLSKRSKCSLTLVELMKAYDDFALTSTKTTG